MNILVVDAGTSGMKGLLLDESGRCSLRLQRAYQPDYLPDGHVEQDPEDWVRALTQIVTESAHAASVDAIALTSQRSSVLPVDDAGQPLHRAVMWQDKRNESVCAGLKEYEQQIVSRCGSGVNTVYSGGKMAWFRKAEPVLWEKTKKLLVVPDYLIWHMTGQYRTDVTYGSRSLLMDLRTGQWDDTLLSIFGLDRDKLCELVDVGSVIGTVHERFAAHCGLKAGIPVISGGGDQQCAALGLGVLSPGTVSINLGTGAYLVEATNTLPVQMCRDMVYGAAAISGQYLLERSVLACCCAIDWFLDEFYSGRDYDHLETALRTSPVGARGVRCLPFFQGRSAPDWNSGMTGVFSGLTLSSHREDLLRALLEGLCFEIAEHLADMEDHVPAVSIRVSGGLSRSGQFDQLLADVLGRDILVSDQANATAAGAWISAVTALGLYSSPEEAWRQIRPVEERAYHPNSALAEVYEQNRQEMRQLYQAAKKWH